MTVQEIYEKLNELSPFQYQLDFDNAGFLVGDPEQKVKKILVALDITEETIKEAVDENAQLIVSHHPVIFNPLKKVRTDDANGRKIILLIKNNISAICMHTNLDATHDGVNDCLATALKLTDVELLEKDGIDSEGRPYGIGRIGLVEKTDLNSFLQVIKENLKTPNLRFVNGGRPVSKVAVGGGSCGSMLNEVREAGCDTFVTADVKYDVYLEAKAYGINLIDAGHFSTERVVCPMLRQYLLENCTDIEVMISQNQTEVFSGF